MIEEKLNKDFRIRKEELESRVNNPLSFVDGYDEVIPLKSIFKVEYVLAMPRAELESLLRNIPLRNNTNLKSYKNSEIKIFRLDPGSTKMIQTYILESKLLNFQINFGKFYHDFCFPRLSKMPAHYVAGRDNENRKVVGIYIPPIVEYINGSGPVLIDGTHRGTIVHNAGTTIEVVGIFHPSLPLPCEPLPWHENIVKIKPPLEERFRKLDLDFIKDFNYVGIDG